MHYEPARFEIVSVRTLPWPHKPFKCAHRARFDALATGSAHEEWAESQRAFKRFYATLDMEDIAHCPYHQVDWHRACSIATMILRAHHEPFDWITVEEMTRAQADDHAIVGAVSSLFSEPIRWVRDAGSVTNGQHRICALMKADVAEVVVAAG
jgi:hypothetical protein